MLSGTLFPFCLHPIFSNNKKIPSSTICFLAALAPEKVAEIIGSTDFQSFFDRSTRLIERALNEYDVAVDYAATEEEEEYVFEKGEKFSFFFF